MFDGSSQLGLRPLANSFIGGCSSGANEDEGIHEGIVDRALKVVAFVEFCALRIGRSPDSLFFIFGKRDFDIFESH